MRDWRENKPQTDSPDTLSIAQPGMSRILARRIEPYETTQEVNAMIAERDSALEPGTVVQFYIKQELRDRSVKREERKGTIRSVSYPLARVRDDNGTVWTVHLDDIQEVTP